MNLFSNYSLIMISINLFSHSYIEKFGVVWTRTVLHFPACSWSV